MHSQPNFFTLEAVDAQNRGIHVRNSRVKLQHFTEASMSEKIGFIMEQRGMEDESK